MSTTECRQLQEGVTHFLRKMISATIECFAVFLVIQGGLLVTSRSPTRKNAAK
jgi:hypothetical protein